MPEITIRERYDKELVVDKFDSFNGFLDTMASRPKTKFFRLESSKPGSWSGSKNWEEADNLARNGWKECLGILKEAKSRKGLDATQEREKMQAHASVVGFAPIVPNAIAGIPKSMIHRDRCPAKVRAITIAYGFQAHCGVEPEEMEAAAKKLLQTIKSLEMSNIRVELLAGNTVCEYGRIYSLQVKIKGWQDPINYLKVAYPMAHPSMLRRHAFRALETCPMISEYFAYQLRDGYGRPISNDYSDAEVSDFMKGAKIIPQNSVYISNKTLREMDSYEEVLDAIKDRIQVM